MTEMDPAEVPAPAPKQSDPLDDVGRLVKRAQRFAASILKKAKAGDIVIKDAADANKLLQSIASLSRSTCELEKLRFEKAGALKIAMDQLAADVRLRLQGRPDLQAALHAELYGAHQALMQNLKSGMVGQVPNRMQSIMVGHPDNVKLIDSRAELEPED